MRTDDLFNFRLLSARQVSFPAKAMCESQVLNRIAIRAPAAARLRDRDEEVSMV